MTSYTDQSDADGETPTAAASKPPELLDDPDGLEEFRTWKLSPDFTDESPFIKHLIVNDVQPCLTFTDLQVSFF